MADSLFEIVCKIAESIGFKKSAIVDREVEIALERRMQDLGITDREAYRQLIQSNKSESQELIELLVNKETWFFRDPVAFDFFIREVVRKRAVNRSPISVFVGPCSTGEEAYSVMMKLLDAGYKSTRVQIDAYDISRQAIEKARAGVYGKRSFRGKNLKYLSKYFHEVSGEYIVNQELKDPIKFYNSNLVGPHLPSRFDFYDVIFCRNLLIYLNECSREMLLNSLKKLMHSDSVLLVSPSEIEIARKYGLCDYLYNNEMIYFEKQTMLEENSLEKRQVGVGSE